MNFYVLSVVLLISNLNIVTSLQEHEIPVASFRGVLMYWIVRYLGSTIIMGIQVDIIYITYISMHIHID